jgi:hypothetical protein
VKAAGVSEMTKPITVALFVVGLFFATWALMAAPWALGSVDAAAGASFAFVEQVGPTGKMMTSKADEKLAARDCSRHAQSCRKLAARSLSGEQQVGLLRLAEAWEWLAREAEAVAPTAGATFPRP